MKIKLALRRERYDDVKRALEACGIDIDENADLVLCENNTFVDYLSVRTKATQSRAVVAVADIVYLEAFGHSVDVHTASGVFQSAEPLYRLANMLDPAEFLRISNSVIIARGKVKQITPTLSMKFVLSMENGKRVDVTRTYYHIFKEFFGI